VRDDTLLTIFFAMVLAFLILQLIRVYLRRAWWALVRSYAADVAKDNQQAQTAKKVE
jgi:hypothetical protein